MLFEHHSAVARQQMTSPEWQLLEKPATWKQAAWAIGNEACVLFLLPGPGHLRACILIRIGEPKQINNVYIYYKQYSKVISMQKGKVSLPVSKHVLHV